MGVAGCGKTLLGQALAERLGWRFVEGDALHPAENVAHMAAGLPLTDELRIHWLDAVGLAIADTANDGVSAIAACSALKRTYRDQLRGWHPNLTFVHLVIDKQTARDRVASRVGHFMPASLVDSQFATLEPPEADENALRLDGTLPLSVLVEKATAATEPASGRRVAGR
jgi:gluconokinase